MYPGGVNLQLALEKSGELFSVAEGARPQSTKVLVIITDKKSDSSSDDVKTAAGHIIQEGIRIIVVPLGNDADDDEIEQLTPNIDDVVRVKAVERIPDKIMERAVNGKFPGDLGV